MKKTMTVLTKIALAAFVLTAMSLSITGCTKKEVPSTPAVTETKPETVQETEKHVVEPLTIKEEVKMIPAVMLWDEASLWYEKPDGKMYWKVTVDYGTAFDCYSKVSADSTNALVESKNAIRVITSTKEEAQKEFTKIKYQNEDYWVQTAIIAINAEPAVIVKENTFIYKAAEIDKITKDSLAKGTIIALSKDEPINGFCKIAARVGQKLYEDVYIKEEKISSNSDDIKALSMIKLIRNTKEKSMQLELLDNTKTLQVSDDIQEVLNSLEDELINGSAPASDSVSKAVNDLANSAADVIEEKAEEISSVIRQEAPKPRIIDDDAK